MDSLSEAQLREEIAIERDKIGQLERSIKECEDFEREFEQEVIREVAQSADVSDADREATNEWKIRYESQLCRNEQLERQAQGVRAKVAEMQGDLKTIMKGGQIDAFRGANPKKAIIQLKRQKQSLESELKDYEWRLDHEATQFHKADEKRKALLKDIKQKAAAAQKPKGKGTKPKGAQAPSKSQPATHPKVSYSAILKDRQKAQPSPHSPEISTLNTKEQKVSNDKPDTKKSMVRRRSKVSQRSSLSVVKESVRE